MKIEVGTKVKDICGLAELTGTVVGEWNCMLDIRCDIPFKNSCGQTITGWVAWEHQLVVLASGSSPGRYDE